MEKFLIEPIKSVVLPIPYLSTDIQDNDIQIKNADKAMSVDIPGQ